MTVRVSQNKSRVIGFPLSTDFASHPGGTLSYNKTPRVALRTDPHVTAGRILDRRQRARADNACGHFVGIDVRKPLVPVGPPRSLMLLRALEPIGQRHVPDIVVGPELVFA